MVISEKIISKDIIKPSSPTPNRLKIHKLCYFDSSQPLIYASPIFFYRNVESINRQQVEISQMLKHSLSKILNVFYPLAGTLRSNSFVDCDDTGVEFIEAYIEAHLQHVIEEPNLKVLEQLVPRDVFNHSDNDILSVKVSFFECGGITIGLCFSHKVADFASVVTFMNEWANTCRGDTDQAVQPFFDLANHFPATDLPQITFSREEKTMTKKLVFDKEKLESLRQRAALGEVKNPSRVEALSAFICQQFIEATKVKENMKNMSFTICHAVNLRPRLNPLFLDHSFGNCVYPITATVDDMTDISDLLSKLRVAIGAVDNDYIKKIIINNELPKIKNDKASLLEPNTKFIYFSSCWRFPVYNTDFGWGNPVYLCLPINPIENTVLLLKTPCEDGIEAWVTMHEDLLKVLESNYNKLLT